MYVVTDAKGLIYSDNNEDGDYLTYESADKEAMAISEELMEEGLVSEALNVMVMEEGCALCEQWKH